MSPLYPSNEWVDINIYFTIGKAIFSGKTLYSEAFDPKGPLIFFIYGFGSLISSSTFIGIFLFLWMGWTTALCCVFWTAKKILGNDTLSFIVALLTPIISLKYMHTGGSPEEFILILQLICLYIFVNFYSSKIKSFDSRKSMFVLGIATSMIFFLKLNLTVFCFFPLVGLFICNIWNKEYRILLRNTLAYLAGIILVCIPICMYLYFNDALLEAYNTYIVLNKNLAVKVPFYELLRMGAKRVYEMFGYNPIGATLILIGAIYFPLVHLKSYIGKVSFILGAGALYGIIFFAGVAQFYYPLALHVLLPLGLISIAKPICRFVTFKINKALLCVVALLIASYITSFFEVSSNVLLRKEIPPGANYYFAEIIKKEKNATLLNTAFGDCNNIYTLCNIVPNIQFFTTLNISYDIYPILRDEQTRYIQDKEILFVVVGAEDEYFSKLPALADNYTLVDTYKGLEEYQNVRFPRVFNLYKRKE